MAFMIKADISRRNESFSFNVAPGTSNLNVAVLGGFISAWSFELKHPQSTTLSAKNPNWVTQRSTSGDTSSLPSPTPTSGSN